MLIDLPKGFTLRRNQVLFLDKNTRTFVQELYDNKGKLVSRNLDSIKAKFEKNGLEFIYIPELIKALNFDDPEQKEYFKYFYPYLNNEIKDISQSSTINYNSILTKVLGIEEEELSCLCFRSSSFLKTFKVDSILSFNDFLDQYSILTRESISFSKKKPKVVDETHIEYRRVREELLFDSGQVPDAFFESQVHIIAQEVIGKIERIKNPSAFKILIDILSSQLAKKTDNIISRLTIDQEYRIRLVDYGDMEIQLTPLQKTVYLFYLNHPEGIAFSSLFHYKDELLSIYLMLSNRENLDSLRSSIEDLINPLSNSLSEKCSRIRSAFLINIDDSLASNYYIDGGRGHKKYIILSRELVIYQNIDLIKSLHL